MKNILLLLFFVVASVHAKDVPRMINYTGVLADQNGKPLSGKRTLTFKFGDVRGNELPGIGWTEKWSDVVLTGGMFTVPLGSKSPLPLTMTSAYNFVVTVEDDVSTAKSLVIPLYAVPFALNIADSAVVNSKIRSGSITPDKFQKPTRQSGKNQVFVFNGGDEKWEIRPENDSTVKTINDLSNNIKILSDDGWVELSKNATGDPQTMKIEYRGIKESVGKDGIKATLSTASDKSKLLEISIDNQGLPLEKLKAPAIPQNGGVMVYDESTGGWQASDPQSFLPVGSVIAFAGDFSEIPQKWMPCDGRILAEVEYPKLFSVLKQGTLHGKPPGRSGMFCLPDMRGMFLRGVDYTLANGYTLSTNSPISGNDPDAPKRTAPINTENGNTGNTVGSVQGDAFQGHRHKILGRLHYFATGGNVNADSYFDIGSTQNGAGPDNIQEPTDDKENGTPRVKTETRPKNVAVIYIIKVLP